MSLVFGWLDTILAGIVIHLLRRGMPKIRKTTRNDTFSHHFFYTLFIIPYFVMTICLLCGFSAEEGGTNPFGILGYLTDWLFSIIKNMNPEYYAVYPDATSTEYMFSASQFWLKDLGTAPFNDLSGLALRPWHLFLAVCLISILPITLYIGIRTGEMLFGTKLGKKGLIGMLQ